jgi:hypothetical protein
MIYSEKFEAYLFESLEEMETQSDSPTVNEYVFDKISNLIINKLDKITLFYIKVEGTIYSTVISKESALAPLQKCLEKFEAQENYEMCQVCLDLIKNLR